MSHRFVFLDGSTLKPKKPTVADLDDMMFSGGQGIGPSGVLISQRPETPDGPSTKSSVLFALAELDEESPLVWNSLPLPLRHGVDIVYISKTNRKHASFTTGDDAPNSTIEVLTTECNPSSANFGLVGYKVDGGVLFRFRSAGERERLTGAKPESLVSFISESIDAIKAALAKDGLVAAKAQYEKMTAVEFKKSFKNWRTEHRAKTGNKRFNCPVVMLQAHCANCGANKEGDKALMACRKCKKVGYCGKECQVEWKDHKHSCGRAYVYTL